MNKAPPHPVFPEAGTILKPHESNYRWVMLGLVSVLYCAFGLISRSVGPLVTPIQKDLNLTYSEMGLILGSWPLSYVAIAATAGTLIDRWGIRRSLFLGIFIIGLSSSLRYFSTGFTTLLIFVLIFGLGGAMISIGCPKTIATWFSGKDRGTAVGVYSASTVIGRLIAFSATNSVVMPLTGYSWRLTFVVFGAGIFLVTLAWWILARDVKPSNADKRPTITQVFTTLIKVRNVQLIMIIGFLTMASNGGFADWLPKILETGGLPPAMAGFAASIPDFVGLPFALFAPRLIPARLRTRMVIVTGIIGTLGLLIISRATGTMLIAGLVFMGIISWAATPLLMLILMDIPEVPPEYVGAAGGIYFTVSEIGGFSGRYVMGSLADLTGGFVMGLIVMAVLRFATGIISTGIKIRPAPEIKSYR